MTHDDFYLRFIREYGESVAVQRDMLARLHDDPGERVHMRLNPLVETAPRSVALWEAFDAHALTLLVAYEVEHRVAGCCVSKPKPLHSTERQ